MLTKFGSYTALEENAIQSSDSIDAIFRGDKAIDDRFSKFASQLKRIAPKSDEFLYFVAPLIVSAEYATINPDGSPKKTASGEIVSARWEEQGEGLKWVCNDSSIKPHKNSNGDIFPEKEIIAAHKQWVSCPVLLNHENNVDNVRGIVLDVYYDRVMKRAIALCAIDKISYPELARKIQTRVSDGMSMGCGVARAQCFNCGKVAKTANDFCNHMRYKSGGYGEVNMGLSPIEFSIVTKPAESQSRIRTVFAAARELHKELDAKALELSHVENTAKIAELETDIKNIAHKLSNLKASLETKDVQGDNLGDISNTAPYGMHGDVTPSTDETNQQEELTFPERYASNKTALVEDLQELSQKIAAQLTSLEKTLQRKNEEMNMATDKNLDKKSYWLGTEEPTPGKKQYPVDPLNEKARMEDKHMVGQPPFPGVGDVDGLHPSPASVDEKDELERKKKLSRAEELNERAIRRQAAVDAAKAQLETKKAYWNGTEEPTPGKKQYPVDPLNEKARMEDKHMVGQPPFPGVGDVDGLHPSPASVDEKDELERKKKLSRASLKARFIKAANSDGTQDLGSSNWQIFTKDESGEKLVLTASVAEISGGRVDALYDSIATKDFGSKMLERVRSVGIGKAASLYKASQAAPPGTAADSQPAAPSAPADMGAPPADAAPADMPSGTEDEGGKGDPKETALKLADKARDVVSDLGEAVRDLTGEQAQMGEMEDGLNQLPKAASAELLPLHKTRVELNSQLLSGMKKSLAELNENAEELALVGQVLASGSAADKDYTKTVVDDVIGDAKNAIADGFALMRAYLKYARGTAGLLKRAEEARLAQDTDANDAFDVEGEEMALVPVAHPDHAAMMPAEHEEHEMENDEFATPEGEDMDMTSEMGDASDMNDVMVDVDPSQLPPGQKLAVKPAAEQFDLTTKAGRSAYRAKIAADATGKQDEGKLESAESLKFSDMLDDAHKHTNPGMVASTIDSKPSDGLGEVETLQETNKRMLEVARMEPRIRQAAERLNTLVSQGKVKTADFDVLIAKHGLDAEVVKYWKAFWGQAGKEGSEFAKLMTTETMKAKQAEENTLYRAKLARAYELSYDMVRRGLLADDRAAIASHVDDVMKWNDEGFESMKRVIARHAPLTMRKEAGTMPRVGMIGSGDVVSSDSSKEASLSAELDAMFSSRIHNR